MLAVRTLTDAASHSHLFSLRLESRKGGGGRKSVKRGVTREVDDDTTILHFTSSRARLYHSKNDGVADAKIFGCILIL